MKAAPVGWVTVALLLGGQLAAQQPVAAPDAPPAEPWRFAAQLYWYLLPDESNVVLPIGYADRGPWHFEARYNYEDRKTASLFAGYTFSFGNKLNVALTPMLGGVVGRTDGIAPGLELTLTFGRLEYYAETQYVFDLADTENNFFYAWTELSYHLTEWIRTGVVAQRTRVYRTERELERGIVLEASLSRFRVGAWWLNPGGPEDFLILGAGVDF